MWAARPPRNELRVAAAFCPLQILDGDHPFDQAAGSDQPGPLDSGQ